LREIEEKGKERLKWFGLYPFLTSLFIIRCHII